MFYNPVPLDITKPQAFIQAITAAISSLSYTKSLSQSVVTTSVVTTTTSSPSAVSVDSEDDNDLYDELTPIVRQDSSPYFFTMPLPKEDEPSAADKTNSLSCD